MRQAYQNLTDEGYHKANYSFNPFSDNLTHDKAQANQTIQHSSFGSPLHTDQMSVTNQTNMTIDHPYVMSDIQGPRIVVEPITTTSNQFSPKLNMIMSHGTSFSPNNSTFLANLSEQQVSEQILALNEEFKNAFINCEEQFPIISKQELENEGISFITYYQQICFMH